MFRKRMVAKRVLEAAAAFAAALALTMSPLVASAADTWSIVTGTPDTSSSDNNVLNGVACVATKSCFAVGSYQPSGESQQSLIEQETSAGWTIVTGVHDTSASEDNALFGVACADSTHCWAVGYYRNPRSGQPQPLVQSYNGSSWSIDTSADNGAAATTSYQLNDISCVSATQCWAVGYQSPRSAASQTFIEQYNGSSWSIDGSSPDTSTSQQNFLFGVTCMSSGICFAVGDYNDGSHDQNLILQETTSAWSIYYSSPDTGAQDNQLQGVDCASATSCWAVGLYNDGTQDQNLILNWSPTNTPNSWIIVTSHDATGSGGAEVHNELDGVTCDAATGDCWAVGTATTTATPQTLIQENLGSGWALAPGTPDTSASDEDFLSRDACPDATDCVAVGSYDPVTSQVLILTNSPAPATPTPTPSATAAGAIPPVPSTGAGLPLALLTVIIGFAAFVAAAIVGARRR